MTLPEFSVKYPTAVLMLFFATLLIGIISISKLSIDMFPEMEPPVISVITMWPGSSASDVESELTVEIEDWLSSINNLDTITSRSLDNLSVVTCKFQWSADLSDASNDIRDSLELAKRNLPSGSEQPMLFRITSSKMPILIIRVVADKSWPSLRMILEKNIVDEIKRIPGVGALMIDGGIKRRINIYFDAYKLEAFHISPLVINKILASENINIPAGSLKSGKLEHFIRIPARFSSADEVKNVMVGNHKGKIIYLRDVAEVSDSYETPKMSGWAGSGKKAILLMVMKQSGENTVDVAERVRNKLKNLKRILPEDVELIISVDSSEVIVKALNNLKNTLILSIFLVVIITLIFLRKIHAAIIISLIIPFSITAALIFLYMANFTINLISMMTIVICIGIVVDNGIVVLENITRHLEHGGNIKSSSIFGANEMRLAITASSATTIIVFLPLMFVEGLAKIVFGQLGYVLAVTLIASLFISITLTPMLASKWLKNETKDRSKTTLFNKIYYISEGWFNNIENFYEKFLIIALKNKGKTIIISLLIFASSLLLIPFISTSFMPEVDSGDMRIAFRLPEGTRLEITDKIAFDIFHASKEIIKPGQLRNKHAFTGTMESGVAVAMGYEQGPNVGQISFKLVDKGKRDRGVKSYADELRRRVEKIPGISEIKVMVIDVLSSAMLGADKPISVEIQGFNFNEILKYSKKLADQLKLIPGLADISISQRDPRPEIWIEIDRIKASSMGLNTAMISGILRNYYYGITSTEFRDAGESFDIFTRLTEKNKNDINRIGNIPIVTPDGRSIKLSSIAKVVRTDGPIDISRKNRAKIVKVGASLLDGYSLGYAKNQIKKQISKDIVPEGVFIKFGSQIEEQEKTFKELALLLIIGIIMVYMIMAALFENLRDPLIIMFSLPFAFTGVFYIFFLTGTTLGIMSFMGVVMLMGIVVNNAIVLLDYIRLLLKRNILLYEAVVTTGKYRLRPVLMTTFTTLFGMLPMALYRAEGSEVWNAVGITIIGGLLFSTIITLILIPTIFYTLEKRKEEKQLLEKVT